MPLVTMKAVLDPAHRRQYAVGAFNIMNLELLEAVVSAAEELRSPVILNLAEAHFPYTHLASLCAAVRARAHESPVPVVLNLDHGLTREGVLAALRNGYTSVMLDSSRLQFQANVRATREVVDLCRPLGISVEGELGAVGGDEGGGLEAEVNPDLFTDPEKAAEYVSQTGIDALAVAIGNAHGRYKGEPRLDFERLARIRKAVDLPLVLHGGTGISAPDFQRAIHLGVAKVNFYTGLSQSALAATRQFLDTSGGRYQDYPEMLKAVTTSVREIVSEQIRIFGSEGKAA
jgi:fructose-bisphosphate aldolase, class II